MRVTVSVEWWSTGNCLCQVMEEIKEEKENNGDVPQKEKKQRQLFMK